MAYTKEQWNKTKGYYEAGLSLAKIKDKTGIARNTISQRAKKEQWEHGKNTDYIEAKELIAVKKGTEKEQSIECADEIADDNIRRSRLVYGATEKILKLSADMAEKNKKQIVMKVKEYSKEHGSSESLDKIDVELDASDLKNLAETVDKASVTLGINARHANSQVIVNNQNNLQQNTSIELTEEQAKKKALDLGVPLSALTSH